MKYLNRSRPLACSPRGRLLTALALLFVVACSSTDGDADGSAAGGGPGAGGAGGGSGVGGSGATSTGGTGNGSGGFGGSNTGGTGDLSTGGSTFTGGEGGGGTGGSLETGGSSVGGTGGTDGVEDVVTRAASTFTFAHFPIETDGNDVWSGPLSPTNQPTSTTYDTVVLENGILRVTLLPEYGGRILSMVHKPTNTELLYQNPLGTPYLMQEDIFYYNYLMILGGIFPSFPDPEHGRYWNQPYAFEVVSESEEAITVRMSRQDDLDLASGVPELYNLDRTDVLVELEITLRAGRSNLELNTRLTNTRSTAVDEFEYWTVTTLAPGSTPGDTKIPQNTRIIANMEQVRLLEESWSWFGAAEERVADDVFTWNNLSYFENWVEQGTAFANPSYASTWSGLINYDTDNGIVRTSDPTAVPGLKLWTFGRESVNIDMNDPDEWLRPTIEMWHGITPEFFVRTSLAPGEVREWGDSYFATFGMREITAANEYGAMVLSSQVSGADTTLSVTASLTVPNQTVSVRLLSGGTLLHEEAIVVSESGPTIVSVTAPSSETAPGSIFLVELVQGDSTLLEGQITL
jgi:hypothetical protein